MAFVFGFIPDFPFVALFFAFGIIPL